MGYNIVLDLFCILVLIIIHIWISMDMMIERARKKRMNICILLTFISLVSEMICLLVDSTVPELRTINIIGNIVRFVVSPFILIIEAGFYNTHHNKGHFLCYVAGCVNIVHVLMSLFNNMIFRIDEFNTYSRGEFYHLYAIAFAFSIGYSIYKKMRTVKTKPSYFFYRSMLTAVFLYPAFFIQVFFPEYALSLLVITIHLLFSMVYSAQLENLSDNLTRLLNRNAFDKHMETLRHMKKKDYAIIMIDVDNFKEVNDKLGHSQADQYLRLIASKLKEVYISHVYRYGGDEFVVVLPSKDEKHVKDTISLFIQKLIALREKDKNLPTVSYGYALNNQDMIIDDVLKCADIEMYVYKNKEKL